MNNEQQDDRHDDAVAGESRHDDASQQTSGSNDAQEQDNAGEKDAEARADSRVDAIAIGAIVLILVGLAVFYVSR